MAATQSQPPASGMRVWLVWVVIAFAIWVGLQRFGILPDLSDSETGGYLDGVARRATGDLYYGFLIAGFLGSLGYGLALLHVVGRGPKAVSWIKRGLGKNVSLSNFAQLRAPVRDAITLFPGLGFLGTVVGVSVAIGGLRDVMDGQDPATLISGLRTAFDTTFLGLVASLVLTLVLMAIDQRLASSADQDPATKPDAKGH